ncbi:MAG: DUF3553 domain-containing protein [Planctomycetota bacterium]
MTGKTTFNVGDKVAHPRKPEWGTGVVREASIVTHQGSRAQRLRIDFANKRNAIINTAIAPIVAATADSNGINHTTGVEGTTTDMSRAQTDKLSGNGWLDELETSKGMGKGDLWDLPASLNDPFSSNEQRLAATLETFKYSTEPGPLFQWAVVQTGEDDPLTKYTRVELEQAFPRYARDRDNHLFGLVRQMKREGQIEAARRLAKSCKYRAGRAMLEKALRS